MAPEHDQGTLDDFEEEEGVWADEPRGNPVHRPDGDLEPDEAGEWHCTVLDCDETFDWKWERDQHAAWHESEARGGGLPDGP